MTDVGLNAEISSSLLDEVFNEIDSVDTTEVKPTSSTSGFLEDVAAAEIDSLRHKKTPDRRKCTKESDIENKCLEERINSLIHEGLTDSSDDEENKYFEESRYNECGKDLKKLLKEKTTDECGSVHAVKKKEPTFRKSAEESLSEISSAREKLQKILQNVGGISVSNQGNEKETKGLGNPKLGRFELDPILHMRIINPLVSSTVLKEKMIGRISVATCKVQRFLGTPESKTVDWVTGGAITKKVSKTSQNGNQYLIWELSDLVGDIKTVSVFLFGAAHKEHWKTPVGMVVGILNPVVMENKGKHEATLNVDNPHKILLMGTSKDYGICKGKTKNGENCWAVVNTNKCEFCTRHLQKEYKKACRRSDLQPPKAGRLMDFKAKLLGKNQSSPGQNNQMFHRVTGKKSSKQLEKDRLRLQALSCETESLQCFSQKSIPKTSGPLLKPTFHDENKEKPKVAEVKTSSASLVQPQTRMIDLCINITAADRARAKATALNYVRKNGPIKKPEDDARKKRTPKQIESVKRKLEAEEEERALKRLKDSGKNGDAEMDPKKKKLESLGMSDKFFELMNAGVKNQILLETAEKDERNKYFDKLETREKMEEKMATTFKVECNAVRCLKCHYKAFSASDLCKREKHPLKVFKAMKRFWKCSNCPARAVSLELYPLHPCKTCGNAKWERASMMPEKGPNLTVEPLSLRGHEEKFIGSTLKNASLNLLVPEEVK